MQTQNNTEKTFGRGVGDCEGGLGAALNTAGLRAMMTTPRPSWKQ